MQAPIQNFIFKEVIIFRATYISIRSYTNESPNIIQKNFRTKKRITRGYAQFAKDSQSLSETKLVTVTSTASRFTLTEVFNRDTEYLLSNKRKAMTAKKGISIYKIPTNSVPRGVLISECIKESNWKKSNLEKIFKPREHGLKSENTKREPNKEIIKKKDQHADAIVFSLDDKNIISKEKFEEQFNKKSSLNGEKSQVLKPITFKMINKTYEKKCEETILEKATELNKSNQKRAEIRLLLEKEREIQKQAVANRCIDILDNYQIDEEFLENLGKYPLLPQNVLLENRDFNLYDEIELRIARKNLFEKNSSCDEKIIWKFPTVSSIIDIALSDEKRENLINWQIDMISKLGWEGFRNHMNKIKKRGTDFHKATEKILQKNPLNSNEINPDILKSVKTIENVIAKDFNKEVLMVEEKVFHGGLFYKGRIDCLGYYQESLCLIDWKRSDKPKHQLKHMNDAPIQLAAYIGALLNDPSHVEFMKSLRVNNALIINVTETEDVNFHVLNYQQIEFYWYQWLSSLRKFWYYVLQRKKIEQ